MRVSRAIDERGFGDDDSAEQVTGRVAKTTAAKLMIARGKVIQVRGQRTAARRDDDRPLRQAVREEGSDPAASS